MSRNATATSASVRNSRQQAPKFDSDDDDDKYQFGNNRPGARNGGAKKVEEEPEENLKKIQEKIGHVENESLSSTQRALRMLNETTEIGEKTASVRPYLYSFYI